MNLCDKLLTSFRRLVVDSLFLEATGAILPAQLVRRADELLLNNNWEELHHMIYNYGVSQGKHPERARVLADKYMLLLKKERERTAKRHTKEAGMRYVGYVKLPVAIADEADILIKEKNWDALKTLIVKYDLSQGYNIIRARDKATRTINYLKRSKK